MRLEYLQKKSDWSKKKWVYLNMEQRETPLVQAAEVKPPERISDQEIGNLLAAFGNNESKALTLVLMHPGVIYTKRDLVTADRKSVV